MATVSIRGWGIDNPLQKKEKLPLMISSPNVVWLKPATLLKLTLLHGCFSRFLNCTNATKSRNASQMWLNSQFPASLITFTEEIVNGKFHFCGLSTVGKNPDCQRHPGMSPVINFIGFIGLLFSLLPKSFSLLHQLYFQVLLSIFTKHENCKFSLFGNMSV